MKISENTTEKGQSAFLISAKSIKKAVERNRLRRQLRELLREKTGEEAKKWDISVIIRNNEKKNLNAEALKSDLEKTLEKAQILFKKN